MMNHQTETELSPEALNELTALCGSGYHQVNRVYDDFGDTSWLDEWMEEYIGG